MAGPESARRFSSLQKAFEKRNLEDGRKRDHNFDFDFGTPAISGRVTDQINPYPTWNNISLQGALVFSPGLPSYFLVVLTSVGVDGYGGGSGFNTSGTVNEILSIFRAKRQKRDERRDRE
uniref:Uncharacterized protein n=1 Tax=Vespula pensylvanica TaxID=30213 RepID=A0A834PAI9_VESPE|nr:hypothetical protein H0235_002723 [Vespula pensylvanica]